MNLGRSVKLYHVLFVVSMIELMLIIVMKGAA